MAQATRILADGLTFPEGPRWHQGCLWFSDFYSGAVYSLDLQGKLERQFEVPGQPSGLGWLPDGDLLVVSMRERKLLRGHDGVLSEYADLSQLAPGYCNDMLVDGHGNAYVGNFGFDIAAGEEARATDLLLVRPGGLVEPAAEGLWFPNGTVLTRDSAGLVVAETFANRLTAFDLGEDGSLANRRVWAGLGDYLPDGICMDADGGIWVAVLMSQAIIRVEEGGHISHRIPLERDSYACALGGDEQQFLLVCTSAHTQPDECRRHRSGQIELIELA